LTVDQIRVRLYGDTAIVSGRTRATVSGTAPQTVTLRFTDVFVRREERWIAVSSHATRLAE
jgi:ketosteroid isomerase-like protein